MEQVDMQQIVSLLKIVGFRFVKRQIYIDYISFKTCYKDDEFLKTMDTKKYYEERNQLVLCFINGS